MKTYSELVTYNTLEERFSYLKLGSGVAETTFGHERWMNQRFYRSAEWRQVRQEVLIRDEGLELGILDYPIYGKILIHHINPLSHTDFVPFNPDRAFNPENLISVSHDMHNAIHYGNENLLPKPFSPRMAGDTTLW